MSEKYSGERFLPEECSGEMEVEHFQRYRLAKQLIKNKVVLDAACGEGYGSNILAEAALKVVGLDIDENAVKSAQKKYLCNNLTYEVGSIEKLPFEDNSFDAVISFETIEHVDAMIQKKFLDEICRILKPDGIMIMSTPNKAVYTDLVKGNNPFHIKEFYLKEFSEFLLQYFKQIKMFYQYPDTGYFITQENEVLNYQIDNKKPEDSRYVIAVCSNTEYEYHVNTSKLTAFDNNMFWYLHRYSHEKEQEIIKLKKETDVFEQQQEQAIFEQKQYIEHLESDIVKLRQEQEVFVTELINNVKHRDRDISKLNLEIKRQSDIIAQQKQKIDKYQHPFKYISGLVKEKWSKK